MKMSRTSVPSILLAAITVIGAAVTFPANASSPQDGIALYNKGKFKEALDVFNQLQSSGRADGTVVYYCGLCYQQLRDFRQAKECYQKVIQSYPGSSVKAQAQTALSAFYRTGGTSASASGAASSENRTTFSSSSGSVDLSKCPPTSRVYYKTEENGPGISFMVRVMVNNRPIEMVFDTGASQIVFGKNHLSQLGIAPPPANRPPDFHSSGVGSSHTMPCWNMTADIKLGDMLIPNCPIAVMENLPTDPLLGQTFFKHFAYTVDYGSKSIVLTKKDANVPSPVGQSVPFYREGNEMVVQAMVNGKPYEMYFDTGAMTCAFSPSDIRRLNIEIPDDAQVGSTVGVGGATRSLSFPINSLKVGPIEKRNMEITVVEASKMGKPLLGQTFYAGWQYTIDNENQRINFLRR